MALETKIEWCDGTANYWNGCTKVSEGCKHCYAEARDVRYAEGAHWGKGAPRIPVAEGYKVARRMHNASFHGRFRQDLATGKRRIYKGNELTAPVLQSTAVCRPKLFSNSLSDFWDPEVETEERCMALASILAADFCDFMLLTKRPHQARSLLVAAAEYAEQHGIEIPASPGHDDPRPLAPELKGWLAGLAPSNIALGCSIELQVHTDRLEALASGLDAAAYFVSAEPLLGPLEIPPVWQTTCNLLIVGGESGPQARPMRPDWVENLQTAAALYGIPLHFKQWGEWMPEVIEACPADMQKTGTVLWLHPEGSCYGPDETIDPEWPMVWRAGKVKAGNRLPDGTWATPLLKMPLDVELEAEL